MQQVEEQITSFRLERWQTKRDLDLSFLIDFPDAFDLVTNLHCTENAVVEPVPSAGKMSYHISNKCVNLKNEFSSNWKMP